MAPDFLSLMQLTPLSYMLRRKFILLKPKAFVLF